MEVYFKYKFIKSEEKMIAIPNMEKPKNAFECSTKINPEERMYIYTGKVFEETLSLLLDRPCDDCPLIEVVRCGECKYMRKYALRSDEPTGIWCHRWSVPRLVTDDDFCSYGERRADEI